MVWSFDGISTKNDATYLWGEVYTMHVQSVHIIYASTSGHTEYVVEVLSRFLREEKADVRVTKAEAAGPKDLLLGDILLLASGTWNTGGIEGQLNPHMHDFLLSRARDVSLKSKHVAIVGLGDSRYRYTCRAAELLATFISSHGGTVFGEPLLVVNEPYDQEGLVRKWGEKFLQNLKLKT